MHERRRHEQGYLVFCIIDRDVTLDSEIVKSKSKIETPRKCFSLQNKPYQLRCDDAEEQAHTTLIEQETKMLNIRKMK